MERKELGGGWDATRTQLRASWSYGGQEVSKKEQNRETDHKKSEVKDLIRMSHAASAGR